MVVQDDDSDHHPEAERHRLLAGETAAIIPDRIEEEEFRRTRSPKQDAEHM